MIMNTYDILQHYWWAIISLLGGLLVFLLFVQGGNTTIFSLGKTEEEKRLIVNSTGRKWELTFTTLVTFGGAAFASFPLFYSTSFGGAYWVWMIILFSFVLQAVSYEFQNKVGNLLGTKTYRIFLVINGIIGPLFLGMAVATFFSGSDFIVNKGNVINLSNPVISQWTNSWHGLEAVTVLNNVLLGVAVLFLSRILGMLYFVNNINNVDIETRIRKGLLKEGVIFLIFFLGFLVRTLLSFGFAVNPSSGEVMIQPYKYLYNFMQMPIVTVVFLIGVVGVLWGLIGTIYSNTFKKGIWFSGAGTVLTVFALLLCVGYNNTPYYPSRMDLESSLTLANSCSSQFTLTVMSWVSILVPFVLAYIFYVWRKLDSTKIDATEISDKGNDSY
jgi:cytochrome bd ubiquinol oxidase subunit II